MQKVRRKSTKIPTAILYQISYSLSLLLTRLFSHFLHSTLRYQLIKIFRLKDGSFIVQIIYKNYFTGVFLNIFWYRAITFLASYFRLFQKLIYKVKYSFDFAHHYLRNLCWFLYKVLRCFNSFCFNYSFSFKWGVPIIICLKSFTFNSFRICYTPLVVFLNYICFHSIYFYKIL